ncbi:MAG TPA: calcium-binding protein [Kamptonema sp.]|nr:calcium-binding protein [Kamptonema sp.]
MSKFDDKPNKSKSAAVGPELKPIQLDETIVAGRKQNTQKNIEVNLKDLLEGLGNFHFFDLEDDEEDLEGTTFAPDEFETKIQKILGVKNIDVSDQTLKKYLHYLKQNIKMPCNLTGQEDFLWEEEFVFGYGNKKEYEKLKKTRPSYTDIFKLLRFEDLVSEESGILVEVQRISDKKKFTLPLSDLEATDESSPNSQLLEDYAVWFVNYF